jgi:SAM-dependent methyltransferase
VRVLKGIGRQGVCQAPISKLRVAVRGPGAGSQRTGPPPVIRRRTLLPTSPDTSRALRLLGDRNQAGRELRRQQAALNRTPSSEPVDGLDLSAGVQPRPGLHTAGVALSLIHHSRCTLAELGLHRFDGHPPSGAWPRRGCPSWRPWNGRRTEKFFRPGYKANLVASWLPALDGVTAKLETGATVADVGCGHGASTVIMAQAYPNSMFTGYDFHPPSITAARQRATDGGVADRVTFSEATAKDYDGIGFDLVCFFDCLHDMGDPVGAARHAHQALADDGTVLLVEPFAGDTSRRIAARSDECSTSGRRSCARRTRCHRKSAAVSAHKRAKPAYAMSSMKQASRGSGAPPKPRSTSSLKPASSHANRPDPTRSCVRARLVASSGAQSVCAFGRSSLVSALHRPASVARSVVMEMAAASRLPISVVGTLWARANVKQLMTASARHRLRNTLVATLLAVAMAALTSCGSDGTGANGGQTRIAVTSQTTSDPPGVFGVVLAGPTCPVETAERSMSPAAGGCRDRRSRRRGRRPRQHADRRRRLLQPHSGIW